MLSIDEVRTAIETAFTRYRCAVRIEEVEKRVSLKVYREKRVSFKIYRDEDDDNGTLLSGATLSDLRSGHLDRYIEVWREQIRDQGFTPS